MLHEAAKKVKLIRHWIKLAQDQQKSYVDQMSKKLKFGVDKKSLPSNKSHQGYCRLRIIRNVTSQIY